MPSASQVEVTRQARADIERLVRFLAEHSPAVSDRLQTRLIQTLGAIGQAPQTARRWAAAPPDIEIRERILRLGRSTYLIRYAVTPGVVIILRVHHGREDRGVGLEG